mgnify:CR=1 FL=1
MSHTPKTTIQCPVCDREDWDISPAIQARYDGCAGLNPTAYRACVEAGREALDWLLPADPGSAKYTAWDNLRKALDATKAD